MTTRSKGKKLANGAPSVKPIKTLNAEQKVFFFDQQLLEESEHLKFEMFHHPGKGKRALFIADVKEKKLFEVKEFAEPNRSWLINSGICSNGKIYITVPIDCTFLVLYYLKKFCSERAMALSDIVDENDASVNAFLSENVHVDRLDMIADVKTSGGDKYYKYNPKRTLAWLAVKVKNLIECLKNNNVYCGVSAQSQNFKESDAVPSVEEGDYVRNACEIVGSYLEMDLYEDLKNYFGLNDAENKANGKRKSTSLDTSLSKKIKLEESFSENIEESPKAAAPVKEKKVSAKEKALAKGAKGTKSIASFFKK